MHVRFDIAAWRLIGIVLAVVFVGSGCVRADERIQFPGLEPAVSLNGFLYRPAGNEPAAAVVFLHGCSGLASKDHPFAIYRGWRDLLVSSGYVVLMVDSAGSRGFGQTCTRGEQRKRMWAERPRDAYAALRYLQQQAFVRSDRIALAGWSQGGGVVLLSIPQKSSGRPDPAPAHDFAAAVAFYPGACSEKLQSRPFVDADPSSWTTTIPLLVLHGDADNWTPPKPCETFLRDAKARNAPVTYLFYPGAAHAFDQPGTPLHAIARYREGNWTPVVGTDEVALSDARTRVVNFLASYLGAEPR